MGKTLIGDDGKRGTRWADGRSTDLGLLPVSLFTYPVAVSRGGTIVVGQTNGGPSEGFRWERGQIAQFGMRAYPTDMSADGSVIAGYHGDGMGRNVAFRWADGRLTDLGYLRPRTHTEAWAISGDGSTVVGYGQYTADDGETVNEAFRWRDGVMLGLGAFDTGNRFYSTANDVSASGAVVVGTTRVGTGVQAFRWDAGVMTGLGVLPDYQESVAQVVSGNGSLIFGRCQRIIESEESFVAFVWDQEHGMQQLDEVLATDFPLDVAGWTLEDVFGVSADGRTLVGNGKNPSGTTEGWIAQLGRP